MASLRRLNDSPFWVACFTLPDGRRTNRSTKTSDRRLAQKLADEWQTAATKARKGHFVEAQARAVLNDILDRVGQELMPSDTVDSFLRQWLGGKDGNTARRYGGTIKNFLEHINDKKHAALSAVSHQDILGFMDSRAREGVAPKTLGVDIGTLGAAFKVARKLGLVIANPVERALAIRPITVESSRRECFSSEQVGALIAVADGDWKTMILLGYYTGARLGDCANLRWADVNLAQSVIDFMPQKTHRKNNRLVVPIHPNLLAHLKKCAASDLPKIYLCPSMTGKPTCGKNGLSNQFKRNMAKAGIDGQTGPGSGIRQFSKLSFHSLRHSFNSALANAGVSQETRMLLTGHSSKAVNGTYTHLELHTLKQAVEKIPRISN